MIRYDDASFDVDDALSRYVNSPATVISDGILGKFDNLKVALEHVQSKGVAGSILAVHPLGEEELQFTDAALTAIADRFYEWPNGR